jgi:hypothetical protein
VRRRSVAAIACILGGVGCRSTERTPPSEPPPSLATRTPSGAATSSDVTTVHSMSEAAQRFREMFGATTTAPDLDATIAKLEAMRKSAPAREQPLFDRAIAVARETAAGSREHDRANPHSIAAMRGTIDLLEQMAALAPDDADTIAMVAAALHVEVGLIDGLGLAQAIPQAPIAKRSRELAARLVAQHPDMSKAWAVQAGVLAYDDFVPRIRALAQCAKLDPKNTACVVTLASARDEYLQPYCDAHDARPRVTWREASRKPMPGATAVTLHYETYYLGATAFSMRDAALVRAGEELVVEHLSDGGVNNQKLPSVTIELRPEVHDRFAAWTASLEKRGDLWATMLDDRLMFVDDRPLVFESSPGIMSMKLDELCTTSKMRTLPADL